MPWSSDEGKDYVREELMRLRSSSILDVGPGAGTYGRMVRSVLPDVVRLDAVEVWEPYVEEFGLHSIYDHVHVADARDFLHSSTVVNYDVIIMGDVVEHFTRDDAIQLVDALRERCKYMIVSLPIVVWEQGAHEGNEHETHLHHWSHEEFKEVFSPMRAQTYSQIGVYVLKGDLL